MKVRAIKKDENNHSEWCFGHSLGDYRYGQTQVIQDIYTALYEWKYNCFFALENGIDWYTRLGFKNQKDILTVRVPNDKVEEMYKSRAIDWNVVFQDITQEELRDRDYSFVAKTKSWKKEFSKCGIDTERPIFFYFYGTDHFYRYDNILELRRSLHLKCGEIIDYIDYGFKSGLAQYFISWDEESLKNRVKVWKKKYKK